MATTQYIGSRYVPIFGRAGEDSIDWDNSKPYEPLTIVLYQGNSYTSRQFVPSGIDISNGDFWAQTGDYNAQVEQYRQEALKQDWRITENQAAIAEEVARAKAAEEAIGAKVDAAETTANTADSKVDALTITVDKVSEDVTKNTEDVASVIEDFEEAEPKILTAYNPNAARATKVMEISIGKYQKWRGPFTANGFSSTIYLTGVPGCTQQIDANFYQTPGSITLPAPMPLAAYTGMLNFNSGTASRFFAPTGVMTDENGTVMKARVFSNGKDDDGKTNTVRINMTGCRAATPYKTLAESTVGDEIANTALSFYQANVDNPNLFAYGLNWAYGSSSNKNVTDANGACLMECDTLAFMAVCGKPFSQTPYGQYIGTPNATTEYSDFVPANKIWYNSNATISSTITTLSKQGWFMWNQGQVSNNYDQIKNGDLIYIRGNYGNQNTNFDMLSHTGVIVIEGGVKYLVHFTSLQYSPTGRCCVKEPIEDYMARQAAVGGVSEWYYGRIKSRVE